MIVTKLTVAFGVVAYLTLWALAVTGLPFLIFYLLLPLVLAALIALGAWLTRYMGLPTSSPKFHQPGDDEAP